SHDRCHGLHEKSSRLRVDPTVSPFLPRRPNELMMALRYDFNRSDPMTKEPFVIAVPEDILTDLRERLARTRWPDEIGNDNWQYGTNLAYLKELVDYWRYQYDWRQHERAM